MTPAIKGFLKRIVARQRWSSSTKHLSSPHSVGASRRGYVFNERFDAKAIFNQHGCRPWCLWACATALSQSAPIGTADNKPNASHVSTRTSELMTRLKKAGTRRGVPVDAPKPDASWFKQMRDPCQVEG